MKNIIKHGHRYDLSTQSNRFVTCPECGEKIYLRSSGNIKLLHCIACTCIFEYEDCDICEVVDADNEKLIEKQDIAFDKFSKTDLYKSILGIAINRADDELAANNDLNKWLEEDIDE